MTAQGHARSVFRRAIERGNLLVAETTAREMGRVSLEEALALTRLIAERDPDRFERVAARWLRRYFEERPDASVDEIAFVSASLHALGVTRTRDSAAQALNTLVAHRDRTDPAPRYGKRGE
jgi:hypothetical protein